MTWDRRMLARSRLRNEFLNSFSAWLNISSLSVWRLVKSGMLRLGRCSVLRLVCWLGFSGHRTPSSGRLCTLSLGGSLTSSIV